MFVSPLLLLRQLILKPLDLPPRKGLKLQGDRLQDLLADLLVVNYLFHGLDDGSEPLFRQHGWSGGKSLRLSPLV